VSPRTLGKALILTLCLAATAAAAETVYVTDQLRAGLHEEKRLESPILKTVPTGTPLEIIKREDEATFVRDPDGASGWIDNSYLLAENPGTPAEVEARNRIRELEQQLEAANQEIRTLEARAPREAPEPADVQELRSRISQLQADLKAEKLKAGELQVQMAELRKRLGMDNEKEALYDEIEDLKEKNKELEVRLAQTREESEAGMREQAAAARGKGVQAGDWRRLLIYAGLALFIGLIAGVYIMDIINRRRHGGFRV
jgi:SH3 domain protein